MGRPRKLESTLNEEGLEAFNEGLVEFDYQEAAELAVDTFLMCVMQKDKKGVLIQSGAIAALGIELEYLNLTPKELNWVVGVLSMYS